jgi:hypothetical protein
MVEIDPVFAEIIIRRWERFTGGTAVRVESVESPAAVAS